MEYTIGDKVLVEVYVVNTDKKDERLPYKIEVYGERYWVEESDLKGTCSTSIANQLTAGNNIEVGDVISNGIADEVHLVKEVLEDRVYTYMLGYVFKDNIKAVYKKSWEKPRDLQDMSKDELIELVKKLKGE